MALLAPAPSVLAKLRSDLRSAVPDSILRLGIPIANVSPPAVPGRAAIMAKQASPMQISLSLNAPPSRQPHRQLRTALAPTRTGCRLLLKPRLSLKYNIANLSADCPRSMQRAPAPSSLRGWLVPPRRRRKSALKPGRPDSLWESNPVRYARLAGRRGKRTKIRHPPWQAG